MPITPLTTEEVSSLKGLGKGLEGFAGTQDPKELESLRAEIKQSKLAGIGAGLETAKTQALKIKESITGLTADSTDAVAEEDAVKSDLDSLADTTGIDATNQRLEDSIESAKTAAAEEKATLEKEQTALEARRVAEVESITASFAEAGKAQAQAQKREFAGTTTSLARAGSFLGFAASQQGVLTTLANTHRQEQSLLEAKKASAIRAANNAFEDRDFALARELVTNAKDLEQEITDRTDDFINQQLDIVQEMRLQLSSRRTEQEFKDKKATEIMEGFVDAGIDPSTEEIFDLAQAMDITVEDVERRIQGKKDAITLKNKKAKTDADIKLIGALDGIPKGTFVKIGDKTYEGLKKVKDGTTISTSDWVTKYNRHPFMKTFIGQSEEEVLPFLLSEEMPPAIKEILQESEAQTFTPDETNRIWTDLKEDIFGFQESRAFSNFSTSDQNIIQGFSGETFGELNEKSREQLNKLLGEAKAADEDDISLEAIAGETT